MKARAWVFLLIMGLNLLWALSTGGRIYLLFFLVMAMMFGFALLSVVLVRVTLQTTCQLPYPRVEREHEVTLQVELTHRCPLPIAPVLLVMMPPDHGPDIEARVLAPIFVRSLCQQRLYCPHVGAYQVGVRKVEISDVFLLFRLKVRPQNAHCTVLVRPQVTPERALRFSPGEEESALMARATEDTSSPSDTRLWQKGDPLKRIHWKLSARKRELLVRTFEEPMRPDALLLLNCAPPPGDGETAHALRDVLCEKAASLSASQLAEGNQVRLPLMGSVPREISIDHPVEIERVLDALSEEPFDGTQAFERVLMLEMRRFRRTGATAILTAHMDSSIADMIVQMRRMGPYVRVYYAHATSIPDSVEGLLLRLEKNDIEVETIALVNDFWEHQEVAS